MAVLTHNEASQKVDELRKSSINGQMIIMQKMLR